MVRVAIWRDVCVFSHMDRASSVELSDVIVIAYSSSLFLLVYAHVEWAHNPVTVCDMRNT